MRHPARPGLPTIFISATSKDLTAHRQKLIETLKNRGYGLITMEEFDAESADAVEVSLKYIPDCHVFVGIYAYRYGYVPTGASQSVTEMEYHEAERLAKPRLLFVVDTKAAFDASDPIVLYRDDTDPRQHQHLADFKKCVGEKLVWKTFATPDDLAWKVRAAIANWEGWRTHFPAPPVRTYIGRESILETIINALATQKRVALLGIGGIGKTFTAEHLVTRLQAAYGGGVIWETFGSGARDAEAMLKRAMEQWAELHPHGRMADPDTLTPRLVRSWMAEARAPLLIVFDDIWHLETANKMAQLVPENATLLVTSRQADMIRGLKLGQEINLHEMTVDEGVAMLRHRVGDMPTLSALTASVQLVDGHPLALEVLGALIRENVDDDPDFADNLPTLLRDKLEGRSELGLLQAEGGLVNVEATFALTYERMSSDLKRRFRAMGVLAAEAPLPHALLMGVWDEADETIAKERVNALVSKGVLTRRAGHFEMHRLLTVYGLGHLRQNAEEYATLYGLYCMAVIQNAEPIFAQPPDTWQAFEALWEIHIYTVGAVLSLMMQPILKGLPDLTQPNAPDFSPTLPEFQVTLAQLTLRFAVAIKGYVFHRYLGDIGHDWLRMGIATARLLQNRQHEVSFLNDLGLWHNHRGENRTALSYYEAQWNLLHQMGDQTGTATTLNNIGGVYLHWGEMEAALQYFGQALTLHRQHGNLTGEATVLNSMGQVYDRLGNSRAALGHYEQALVLRRQVADIGGEAATLNNMAALYSRLGQPTDAMTYHEQVLTLHQQRGDKFGEALTMNNLGRVYDDLGDKEKARWHYEQALELFSYVEARAGQASSLNNIGRVYSELKEYGQALEYYQQALQLQQQIEDLSGEAVTLNNIATIYYLTNQPSQARDYFEKSLRMRRLVGDNDGAAYTLFNLSILTAHPLEAIILVQLAEAIWQAMDSPNAQHAAARLTTLQQETSATELNQVLHHIGQTYAKGGPVAVRQLLQAHNFLEETIVHILARLEIEPPNGQKHLQLNMNELLITYTLNGATGLRLALQSMGVQQVDAIVEQVEARAIMLQTYQQGGAQAVRVWLEARGEPDHVIEQVIAHLESGE